jgi:hypothetical protein
MVHGGNRQRAIAMVWIREDACLSWSHKTPAECELMSLHSDPSLRESIRGTTYLHRRPTAMKTVQSQQTALTFGLRSLEMNNGVTTSADPSAEPKSGPRESYPPTSVVSTVNSSALSALVTLHPTFATRENGSTTREQASVPTADPSAEPQSYLPKSVLSNDITCQNSWGNSWSGSAI